MGEKNLAEGRIRSGLFEIDLTNGELYKSGRKIALQEQPFRVLSMLLERPGELITRQDLQGRLWPEDTYVGFDEGLNTAIRKLRLAFGDSAENPRFIATVPRRGYRFIAPVSYPTSGESILNTTRVAAQDNLVAQSPSTDRESRRSAREETLRPFRFRYLAMLLLAMAGLLLAWILRPSLPPPRVLRIRQLTRLGDLEYKIVTDGPRIYFGKGNWGVHDRIYSQSVEGGETVLMSQFHSSWEVQSVSPNGSELLARTGVGDLRSVWKTALPSGSPQRLGSILVLDAVWSPDGESIAFTDDASLYVMKNDGSQIRKLATFPGYAARPVWSPDGRRIRLTVHTFLGAWSMRARTIMEVAVASGATHPLLFGSQSEQRQPAGDPNRAWPQTVGWIRNGDYFLFTAKEEGVSNIWAVREGATWLRRTSLEPVRLTAGPMNFPFPIASRDGKTIFAVGEQYRGELMRYDKHAGKFEPFLRGLPADEASFSRDGEWVAYVAYPDRTLWRCRANGEGRIQLTFEPMQVGVPRWSPDGRRISFHAESPGKIQKGYTIAANGGLAEPVLADARTGEEMLSWSPDGSRLMYVEISPSATPRIRILDLKSHEIEDVPDSLGLTGAVWSPDGGYVGAENSASELKLFDFQTGHWTNLAPWGVNVSWSPDSQYLYFDTLNRYPRTVESNPGFFRERIRDRHLEKIFGVPEFNLTGVFGIWVAVTPDGSPFVLKDAGTRDLYALDLELP